MDKMIPRSKTILKFVKGEKILDIGCSDHKIIVNSPFWVHGVLVEKFPYVVGIDYSKENVRKMNSMGFKRIFYQDAEKMCLKEKFDTIVAGEIIEHLSNPGLFLQKAMGHLNPGGRIVLTTPYPFSLSNLIYAFLKYPKTCPNSQHTLWFCPKTIIELVKRFNFEVVHFELIADYPDKNSSFKYRILVWFIKRFFWIIPKRLRNNAMLFVLIKNENSNCS